VVLGEAALRTNVGGPKVMAAQLAALLERTQLSNVAIRVLPLAAGPHQGMNTGPFVLLTFPPGADGAPEPPMVYLADLIGATYVPEEQYTARYKGAFDSLWAAALKEGASVRFITEAMREWT
jgi:hypothetical protein